MAAARHRVARVDHQVDESLFHLSRIAHNRRQIGREHRSQRDVGAERPFEQPRQVGDDLVEIEDARIEELFAAEGQQLLCDRRRPGRRTADFFDVTVDLAVFANLATGPARCNR